MSGTLVDNGVCGPRGALTFNPDTFDELTLFPFSYNFREGIANSWPGATYGPQTNHIWMDVNFNLISLIWSPYIQTRRTQTSENLSMVTMVQLNRINLQFPPEHHWNIINSLLSVRYVCLVHFYSTWFYYYRSITFIVYRTTTSLWILPFLLSFLPQCLFDSLTTRSVALPSNCPNGLLYLLGGGE